MSRVTDDLDEEFERRRKLSSSRFIRRPGNYETNDYQHTNPLSPTRQTDDSYSADISVTSPPRRHESERYNRDDNFISSNQQSADELQTEDVNVNSPIRDFTNVPQNRYPDLISPLQRVVSVERQNSSNDITSPTRRTPTAPQSRETSFAFPVQQHQQYDQNHSTNDTNITSPSFQRLGSVDRQTSSNDITSPTRRETNFAFPVRRHHDDHSTNGINITSPPRERMASDTQRRDDSYTSSSRRIEYDNHSHHADDRLRTRQNDNHYPTNDKSSSSRTSHNDYEKLSGGFPQQSNVQTARSSDTTFNSQQVTFQTPLSNRQYLGRQENLTEQAGQQTPKVVYTANPIRHTIPRGSGSYVLDINIAFSLSKVPSGTSIDTHGTTTRSFPVRSSTTIDNVRFVDVEIHSPQNKARIETDGIVRSSPTKQYTTFQHENRK